jgi:hypothetical protein
MSLRGLSAAESSVISLPVKSSTNTDLFSSYTDVFKQKFYNDPFLLKKCNFKHGAKSMCVKIY